MIWLIHNNLTLTHWHWEANVVLCHAVDNIWSVLTYNLLTTVLKGINRGSETGARGQRTDVLLRRNATYRWGPAPGTEPITPIWWARRGCWARTATELRAHRRRRRNFAMIMGVGWGDVCRPVRKAESSGTRPCPCRFLPRATQLRSRHFFSRQEQRSSGAKQGTSSRPMVRSR
jgi:hypothetical protein